MSPPYKVITRAELEAWCADAAAGERKLYARAAELPQPIGAAARALAERGLVTLARRRAALGDPFEFLAIRLSRPVEARPERPKMQAGAAARAAHARREEAERAAEAVMGALIAAARLNHVCPTNAQLAEIARLPSAEAASKIVCALRDEARIDVQFNDHVGRVVTIRASGLSTRAIRSAA